MRGPVEDLRVADLPKRVHINEEGPREGFQFEKQPIATDRKIALIDALAGTGLKHIQIVSFVSPKAVPGMADAEQDSLIQFVAAAPRRNLADDAAGAKDGMPRIPDSDREFL